MEQIIRVAQVIRGQGSAGHSYPRWVRWAVAGVGYALVASMLTPLTWPAMLATVPPLLLACWMGLRRPGAAAGPAIGRRRILPWLVVIAAGTAWEIVAVLGAPREDYPTISSVLSPLAAGHWWFRFAGYLLWFAAGAWVVSRR